MLANKIKDIFLVEAGFVNYGIKLFPGNCNLCCSHFVIFRICEVNLGPFMSCTIITTAAKTASFFSSKLCTSCVSVSGTIALKRFFILYVFYVVFHHLEFIIWETYSYKFNNIYVGINLTTYSSSSSSSRIKPRMVRSGL